MTDERPHTHQKALELNLDPGPYGTIAEIGAGQEVARWFFAVGGASGTVAKTVSAYDMKVSDERYGRSGRYVSRERCIAMLECEYEMLVANLAGERGEKTSFFAFADTISARNYHGTNVCHGWMGVRFQAAPGEEPNDLLVHLNLNDPTNPLQQEAAGVLGVNLLYAALRERDDREEMVRGLLDGLALDRIEVDHMEARGPRFPGADSPNLDLALLRHGLTNAVVLTPAGDSLAPMDALYKRPLVVERGSFTHDDPEVYTGLMDRGRELILEEVGDSRHPPLCLFELSRRNLLDSSEAADEEILARVGPLLGAGRAALVTSFPETYRLTSYFRRYTDAPVRYTLGVPALVSIFKESWYESLPGGILEAMGRLIGDGVRVYTFGMPVEEMRRLLREAGVDFSTWTLPESGTATAANCAPVDERRHLYRYLLDKGAIVPV